MHLVKVSDGFTWVRVLRPDLDDILAVQDDLPVGREGAAHRPHGEAA